MSTPMRHAFTLIELMIAMVVAAVIAAAVLVALYGAQQEARDARTRAQVAKLNEIVARHWESYTTRNVAVTYSNFVPTARERALGRLLAQRDLMRMELPERITDLIDNYGSNNAAPTTPTIVEWGSNRQTQLSSSPHLFRAYIRRINGTLGGNWNNWSPNFQGAECLYLIVATLRDEESSGLEYFRDSEIGDIDNDLMPELHDGWGNPISFLRWAPGFPSPVQHVGVDANNSNIRFPDRTLQPDHLDLLKVDPAWGLEPNANVPQGWKDRANDTLPRFLAGYLLFPLVYSAGADEDYGIITDRPNNPLVYKDPQQLRMVLDPYEVLTTNASNNPVYVGSPQDPDAFGEQHYADNITNHLIEVR